jgi:type IV secretory pathway VirJ component
MTLPGRAQSLIALSCCFAASPACALVVGRYASIKLAEPPGQARGVVVFFSGHSGLSAADQAVAQAIAKDGVVVAEIDSGDYLSHLDKLDEKCHSRVYDAEILSRQLQRERHFPNYITPIVAGVGEGGTLAELLLAQAPPSTIASAIAIDPPKIVVNRQPICSDLTTKAHRAGFRYGLPKKLPGYCIVGLTPHVRKADRECVMRLRHRGAPVDVNENAADTSLGDALRSFIEPHLAAVKPILGNISAAANVSRLPLTESPVDHPSKLMAVVLSGDGGWRDIDKTIAEDLQQQGIPVVGFDCLRYFWSKKTPEQTASVVSSSRGHFHDEVHADKAALIGYSFGTDVMPFAFNRLPENIRAHVVMLALLTLSRAADFEISVGGWLGDPPGPNALPVIPEAAKIPARMIQCFYRQTEKDTACPTLAVRGVQTFRRDGGHHFDGNYGAVAQLILTGFEERAGLSAKQKTAAIVSGHDFK